ncbi:molybdopterin converting factor subunit 1 [Alphaproteobacteria bacterium]|nr:molybdopterin converting factor subunit 1 [Alphaproteobacteria bacterium]
MNILYFSWIKDKLGKAKENITIDENINSVAELITFLKSKDETYKEVFKDISSIRVSINMETANMDDSISINDEIAFFPPMTGG